jgi:hypothetical protein
MAGAEGCRGCRGYRRRFRMTARPCGGICFAMSTATTALLAAFETLPEQEKQWFVNEVCRRTPPYDSGPLDDEIAARAGDELATLLAREEHDTQTR